MEKLSYSVRRTLAKYERLITKEKTWTKSEITSFASIVRSAMYRPTGIRDETILELWNQFARTIEKQPKLITSEQTEVGLNWLNKTCFTSQNKVRNTQLLRESGFSCFDAEILKNFSHFEFVGYDTDLNTYGGYINIRTPVYRVVSKLGKYFDYSFTGCVLNIDNHLLNLEY